MEKDTKPKCIKENLINVFNVIKGQINADQNLVSSPLSICIAVALLAEGATGKTLTEIVDSFGLEKQQPNVLPSEFQTALKVLAAFNSDKLKIKITNHVYLANSFKVKKTYINTLTKYYHAKVDTVDFSLPSTLRLINDTITDETEGLITNTVSSIDPGTQMILTNAIYFKGQWESPFDPAKTQPLPFTLVNGDTVQVQTMQKMKIKAGVIINKDRRVICLPYSTDDMKMVIEVPTDRILKGSEYSLVKKVSTGGTAKCNVYLPKFKAATRIDARETLKRLGVEKVFEEGFTKITSQGLHLSSAIHQAFIRVDEEGAEAAAVTKFATKCARVKENPPIDFRVDSPFYYHIVDSASHIVLFSGCIYKPEF